MLLSGQKKKLIRALAERDARLVERESRISSLESTIFDLEIMLRDREQLVRRREKSAESELARREETIRERESRIEYLESQIRRLETPRLPPFTDDLEARVRDMVSRLPGWCPEEKALWMIRQIVNGEYKVAVELGVFAGRSVFPIALGIAANQGHAVYAVDAWENAVATETRTSEANDIWWEAVDLVTVKSLFLRETVSQNLVALIKMLELPSSAACQAVSRSIGRNVGFLHIDGGHSEAQSLSDVVNWSQLVAPGGTIVLDDIDWPGVRKADEFLARRFTRLQQTACATFAAYRVLN